MAQLLKGKFVERSHTNQAWELCYYLYSSRITSSTTSEFMKVYTLRLATGSWGTFCINLGTGSVGNQE